MDTVDALLTWLLDNKLITLDTMRVWEAKAYLAVDSGVRDMDTLEALRSMVAWYRNENAQEA